MKTKREPKSFLLWLQVAVYTPPEQIEQATFALDKATKILEHYESFFGIQYPLPKLGKESAASSMDSCVMCTNVASFLVKP